MWPLEQDILSFVSGLFDKLLVHIEKLKGFRRSSKQLKKFSPQIQLSVACTGKRRRPQMEQSVHQLFTYVT